VAAAVDRVAGPFEGIVTAFGKQPLDPTGILAIKASPVIVPESRILQRAGSGRVCAGAAFGVVSAMPRNFFISRGIDRS